MIESRSNAVNTVEADRELAEIPVCASHLPERYAVSYPEVTT
jgi:hypothetical protein